MSNKETLLLIGVNHTIDGNKLHVSDNYRRVKSNLQLNTPGFITVELGLYDGEVRWAFQYLFRGKPEELDSEYESGAMDKPIYGDEYHAAIIYARKHKVPLHFVDLWTASAEDVAAADLSKNPEIILDGSQITTPKTDEQWNNSKNVEKRNRFIGSAIDIVSETHNQVLGAHVGGIDHYTSRLGRPLQEFITTRRTILLDLT